jgi:putative tricarboxylic transport membrane protein
MEILSLLGNGFLVAFQPLNLALVILGCALGLFIGAMPGLGSVNGVAILLPMTFIVPPTGAIIFLAAIYYGAMYGGAISSIMLGIPGLRPQSPPRSTGGRWRCRAWLTGH